MATLLHAEYAEQIRELLTEIKNNIFVLLSGLGLGIAIGLLITLTIKDTRTVQLVNYHTADIASLGAIQAGQSLFNNDLLGLQVILTDIANLPHVQGLTVHDVENRILAQAGNIIDPSQSIHQSAAITQNDNVAGYITVITQTPASTLSQTLWFVLFALAATIIFLALHSRRQAIQPDTNGVSDEDLEGEQDDYQQIFTDNPNTTEETDNNGEPALGQTQSVLLSLHSSHIQSLALQLGAEAFNKQLISLNKAIQSVATLYNAQLINGGQALPTLLFNSQDIRQNSLNALCSGQLILAIFYHTGSLFDLHTKVEPIELHANTAEQASSRLAKIEQKLYLGVADSLLEYIDERVQLADGSGYWHCVEAFDSTYQSLLDNQLQQLIVASN